MGLSPCIGGEIQPSFHEALSFNTPVHIVQTKNPHRHAAFRGEGEDRCSLPLEVLRPDLRAWIEQRDQSPGGRVKRTDIRPFVAIAAPRLVAASSIRIEHQPDQQPVGAIRPTPPRPLHILPQLGRDLGFEEDQEVFDPLNLIKLQLFVFRQHASGIQSE